jgi:hypothetical protein
LLPPPGTGRCAAPCSSLCAAQITLCSDSSVRHPVELPSEPDLQSTFFVKITSSSLWRKSRGCTRAELRLSGSQQSALKEGLDAGSLLGVCTSMTRCIRQKLSEKYSPLYLRTYLPYLVICPLPQFIVFARAITHTLIPIAFYHCHL